MKTEGKKGVKAAEADTVTGVCVCVCVCVCAYLGDILQKEIFL